MAVTLTAEDFTLLQKLIDGSQVNPTQQEQDFVNALQTAYESYTDSTVSTEITARNTAISTAIATEVTNRNNAINTAIATEVTNRDNAIAAAVTAEVTNRNTAIDAAIATEVTNRNTAISDAITTEITARNTAISDALVTAATAAGVAIDDAIATEVTNRNTAIDDAAFTAEAAGGVATARSASELNVFKNDTNTLCETIALIPNVTVTRVNQRITVINFPPASLSVTVNSATLTNAYESLTESVVTANLQALQSAALAAAGALPPSNQIDVTYAM